MGATPSGLLSDPPPSIPIFMLDALPATTLPLYAGLGQAPNMLIAYQVAWFRQLSVLEHYFGNLVTIRTNVRSLRQDIGGVFSYLVPSRYYFVPSK